MDRYVYLIAPAAAWTLSQFIKLSINKLSHQKVSLGDVLLSGNMPSSHVSGPAALLVLIAHKQGISSPLFSLGLVITVLIAYDSIGVRRTAADSAAAIKQINSKLNLNLPSIHVYKGHTPLEVLGGLLLGSLVGLIASISL